VYFVQTRTSRALKDTQPVHTPTADHAPGGQTDR
jgi:hypothetical protein